MNQFFTVAQVVMPIFVAIFLGILAKKKALISAEGVAGMQQFVMQFGLPCVVFNSCYSADIGAESLTSMGLVLPCVLAATFWSYHARKKQFPYHNFPQLFAAQETGMLGIPLFMILFGAEQAYRVGILDLTQAVAAFPTIALLSANTGENPTPMQIAKKVATSPLLIMAVLGLTLNLTGVARWLDAVGIGGIITQSTSFLTQPVSAMMIFSVGYNFSLSSGNRSVIFKIATIHFVIYAVSGVLIQLGLSLIPNVDPLTRWATLLYCTLPASYLAPTLGRTEEDRAMASGVCSILTVVSLAIFCIMAAVVA